MEPSVGSELLWIALILLSHVIALAALIWNMLSADDRRGWNDWWRDWRDDGPDDEPEPPGPRFGPDGLPLLHESRPASRRLRAGERLADAHPRPARRPEHAPERTPVRVD